MLIFSVQHTKKELNTTIILGVKVSNLQKYTIKKLCDSLSSLLKSYIYAGVITQTPNLHLHCSSHMINGTYAVSSTSNNRIYIYAFNQNKLSSFCIQITHFCQFMHFLGIKPMTLTILVLSLYCLSYK